MHKSQERTRRGVFVSDNEGPRVHLKCGDCPQMVDSFLCERLSDDIKRPKDAYQLLCLEQLLCGDR